MLIRTPQEVKKYLRIDITANSADTLPDINTAERKYLVPVLGNTLYSLLQQAYDTDVIPGTRYAALLELAQAVIAPLAYFNDRALINVRITEAGFRKSMTADQAPVYKWDYQALASALQERGMEAIENLLALLEQQADTYPEWKNDPVYGIYTSSIIRTGTVFNESYPLAFPRYCFLQLQPIIRMVEDMYISKSIGAVFFSSLKSMVRPGSGPEMEVLRLLRNAIANLTVYHAAGRMGVQVTARGFIVNLLDKEQYDGQQATADNNSLFKLAEDAERVGHSYLKDAISLLNNTSSTQVFPLYHASSYYESPTRPEEPSINSRLKSSFAI